ncbi:putative Heavy-metal-associated domain (N-terminus) and membrane-bounded cytochrome biogenesis cycZ-like domain, membrane copper tolerance protein [Tenacibaculum sp. 190524A02b]|uniref:sulfite exporter TauE/SafE family protein n=1 Tax=Tenacibaculum vairaonense TaxID=3137860 RepID=UPI0032B19C94
MLISAFILGLLGSFHCIGMCGPIAFMLPIDRSNTIKSFLQITSYHVGRLIAYGIIGLLFSLLGRSFYIFGLQQQLSIFTGVLMILFIIYPKLGGNFQTLVKPLTILVVKLKSALGNQLKKKKKRVFILLGLLNGFLPCGLVYVAVFGALVRSNILHGALYMILFGLGTVPLMVATTFLGNITNSYVKRKLQKIIPYIVVVIGILFIVRGLGLNVPYISPEKQAADITVKAKGCH